MLTIIDFITIILLLTFTSITCVVVMLVSAAGELDKRQRLKILRKNPLLEDILHQVPREVYDQFFIAITTGNIDPGMLEYLEKYTNPKE